LNFLGISLHYNALTFNLFISIRPLLGGFSPTKGLFDFYSGQRKNNLNAIIVFKNVI
jgi:hypothetical protein